jgi:hypothetical protein
MTPAEEALRASCHPEVVEDYDRLASSEKKVMLDAFISTLRNDLLQLTMNEAMENGGRQGGFGSSPLPKKDRPNVKDPPVKALQEAGMKVDRFKQNTLRNARREWSGGSCHPATMKRFGGTSSHSNIKRLRKTINIRIERAL